MDWALWLGIGYGIGWLLWARHGEPRHGEGHQPTVPPANWDIPPPPAFTGYQPRTDNPFGGHEPPNRPVDPAKLVLPQGSGELPPRGR